MGANVLKCRMLLGLGIMAANALIQTRVDTEVRDRASLVLGNMGLTVSDAVRILLTRTANEGALPLELLSGSKAHDAWFRTKVLEALNDSRPDVRMMKSRCISRNAERQPVSTRVSVNLEA